MSNSKIIGITGGIGTGKTFVCRIIKSMNFAILNSDQIAHRLLENDQTVISILTDSFGVEILNANGSINRKALGSIVFNNQNKLDTLNRILDPYLKKKIFEELQKAPKPIFAEIPLLYELNYENFFDQIILVFADNETALKRIQIRDHLTLIEAKKRINSQLSIDEKIKKANYIINTTKGDLNQQIIKILHELDLLRS